MIETQLKLILSRIPGGSMNDYDLHLIKKTKYENYNIYKVEDNKYDINEILELKILDSFFDDMTIIDVDSYDELIIILGKFINIIKQFNIFFSVKNKNGLRIYVGYDKFTEDKLSKLLSLRGKISSLINESIYFGIIPDSVINTDEIEIGTIISTQNDKYVIESFVGEGTYGKVYKAIDNNNTYVAIKEIINISKKQNFLNEFENLKKIQDDNCNKNIVCPKNLFQNSTTERMYLVTNFIDGLEMNKIVKDCSYECFINIIIDILKTLDYINSKGMIHGDIKPENILCVKSDNGYYPILIDFGFSCLIEKSLQGCEGKVGTPLFMAPEVITKGIIYKNSDIWSLGISIYDSIIEEPYKNINMKTKKLMKNIGKICKKNAKLQIPHFDTPSELLNNICNDMLVCKYKKRLNAAELLEKYQL